MGFFPPHKPLESLHLWSWVLRVKQQFGSATLRQTMLFGACTVDLKYYLVIVPPAHRKPEHLKFQSASKSNPIQSNRIKLRPFTCQTAHT